MTYRKQHEQDVDMDMTPMIDVTFQLLIFFIITMKFRTLEMKLNSYLPPDFGLNRDQSENPPDIFVKVKLKQVSAGLKSIRERDTEFFFEEEGLGRAQDGEVYEKIFDKISHFRNDHPDAVAKIDVGAGVPHHRVVAVLDLFHKARFEQITFVGLAANKNVAQGDANYQELKTSLGDSK